MDVVYTVVEGEISSYLRYINYTLGVHIFVPIIAVIFLLIVFYLSRSAQNEDDESDYDPSETEYRG